LLGNLNVLSSFNNFIFINALFLLGLAAQVDTRPQPPELVITQRIDDFAMFRLLVDLNDIAPHPGNILYCGNAVELADLKSFLGRVENFTRMRYFMVGVNELLAPLREALLKWISTLFAFLLNIYYDN
jgi:hypothetical protein